jgi:hypothetical protein
MTAAVNLLALTVLRPGRVLRATQRRAQFMGAGPSLPAIPDYMTEIPWKTPKSPHGENHRKWR